MNIYDDDGLLDLDKARGALDETAAINNAGAQKTRYTEIQIATLLDVAGSLRVLALEAGAAMGYDVPMLQAFPELDDSVDDETRDFLVIGDLVHVIDDTAPGEVMSLGFDDGEPYAIVDFADAKGMRYYVRNLERLVGDAAGDHVAAVRAEEAAIAALPTVGDELEDGTDPDLYDEPDAWTAAIKRGDVVVDHGELHAVDDIDADFEGDHHTAADDALAVLKVNEEKRKAAQRSAKKGKKK